MHTGCGRSPGRAMNSKSTHQISRYGSRSSTRAALALAAQPFDHRMVRPIDQEIAECNRQNFAKAQFRPFRLRYDAARLKNLECAKAHVGLDPNPLADCQLGRLARRSPPFHLS